VPPVPRQRSTHRYSIPFFRLNFRAANQAWTIAATQTSSRKINEAITAMGMRSSRLTTPCICRGLERRDQERRQDVITLDDLENSYPDDGDQCYYCGRKWDSHSCWEFFSRQPPAVQGMRSQVPTSEPKRNEATWWAADAARVSAGRS
jgi:hypothetical protein